MIKKQVLQGRNIKDVDSNLTELQELLDNNVKCSMELKQVFESSMKNGVALHSVNKINIEQIDISYFNNNLIVSINEGDFSIAINNECNISIQRLQGNEKLRIFFEDLKMWLTFK